MSDSKKREKTIITCLNPLLCSGNNLGPYLHNKPNSSFTNKIGTRIGTLTSLFGCYCLPLPSKLLK